MLTTNQPHTTADRHNIIAAFHRHILNFDSIDHNLIAEEIDIQINIHNININSCDKEGKTLLTTAATNERIDLVEILLNKGADCNLFNKSGWTALYIAASKGYTEIVSMLKEKTDLEIKNPAGGTALTIAATQGHLEVVELLIGGADHKADIHTTDNNEWTPLIKAADKGHFQIVDTLLRHGADAEKQDNSGFNALILAAKAGKVEAIKVLLEKGAKINIMDHYKRTALSYAAENGHTEVVTALLANGADINIQDKAKRTALEIAKTNSIKEAIATRDINDKKLILAAKEEDIEKVEALLKLGSYVDMQNIKDESSLIIAEAVAEKLRLVEQERRLSLVEEIEKMKAAAEEQRLENAKEIEKAKAAAEERRLSSAKEIEKIKAAADERRLSLAKEIEKIKAAADEPKLSLAKEKLRLALAKDGFESIEEGAQGDGFFHAVSKQLSLLNSGVNEELYEMQISYKSLRTSAIAKMRTNSEYKKIFEDEASFEAYVSKMSNPGEWAGDQVISALAEVIYLDYRVLMEVFHYSPTGEMSIIKQTPSEKGEEPIGKMPTIRILHNDNHYTSLEPLTNNNPVSVKQNEELANSKISDSENNDNTAIEDGLNNSNKRVREDEEDSSTQTLPKTEESQGFFGGCYISVSFGRFLCRHSIIEDEAVSSSDSSLLLKPLNFIMPKITIEQGHRPLQIKQVQESNPEPSNGASFYSYGDILTGLKALDVSVDVFKLSYEPTREHLSILVRDFAHLGIILTGTGGYLPLINAVDIAAHAYNGEYSQAFTQAGITAGYMLLPTMLGTALAPIYAASVLTYTGYKLATNAYSAYSNYVAPEGQLKSNLAYATLSENLGLQGMAKEYLVNAMQIVKEDVDLGYDDNSPIQDIAAKYDLAGKICEFNADEAYCNG